MEPRFSEKNQRERDVPNEEKQHMFLVAGNILLDRESELSERSDEHLIDTNGHPVRKRELLIDTTNEYGDVDEKWVELSKIGVARAELTYWPERSFMGETLYDQINLGLIGERFHPGGDLYTMILASTVEGFRVNIGNRREIRDLGNQWMEISRQDADCIGKALKIIEKIIVPTLVEPDNI